MNALKGQWIVEGGVIPLQKVPEYTKAWNYTSEDIEKDRANDYAIFIEMRDAAYEYAKSITNPTMLNWVSVNWIWV
jgi:hypothetical protein